MKSMKFMIAMALLLGGAVVGVERPAQANSPSSGGSPAWQACVHNYMTSHNCPTGSGALRQAPQCMPTQMEAFRACQHLNAH